MWIVTKIGFFNIVEQDGDREKGLLTVKARSQEDIENLKKFNAALRASKIEESQTADYRFRMKAKRDYVRDTISVLVANIDYPKTKPVISADFPERSGIYFAVWDTLYQIQCLKENT